MSLALDYILNMARRANTLAGGVGVGGNESQGSGLGIAQPDW